VVHAFLEPFLTIRPTDVVDILLVTSLVYTAVVWIRRTQAGLVALGILLLGALYVVARALDLQMTVWIFHAFFAVFLIVFVIIFQEELRQLFERFAVWSLGRDRRPMPHSDVADVLVQCLSDFARDRVGALIVIPGRQPIARHVRGGIELDGKVSIPLLKSLFDVHSPGHDGAVIIENGRITRYAAHLPLSHDFAQLSGVGTRHSAALGLAELTDVLCLVVSEERGQVSVAQDGRLRRLADLQELGEIVSARLAPAAVARQGRGFARHLVVANWAEKLGALVVVTGLWYVLVPGARPTAVTLPVPVQVVNLPEGASLEEVKPPEVEVTFSGPARAFYLLDRRRVGVTIDASLAEFGRRTFRVEEDDVEHPKALAVEDVQPPQVRLSLRR
jgi:diadenylate cyclase